MDKVRAPRKAQKGIQSIEIGFRLLQPFMTSPGPFSLSKLASAAGMSPVKAHFYLVSLVRVGLLARSGSGGTFSLGPASLHLGIAAFSQVDVIHSAQESLQQLRDAIELPVFLSIWAANGPTIVQHLHGTRTSAWSMQTGAVLSPLTATGRALLAYSSQQTQKSVVERELSRATPEDPWYQMPSNKMLRLLSEIRKTGISPPSGAVVAGFSSIAAAILDHESTAVAAVTIVGDTRHFDASPEGKFAAALLEATRNISYQIGGGEHLSR